MSDQTLPASGSVVEEPSALAEAVVITGTPLGLAYWDHSAVGNKILGVTLSVDGAIAVASAGGARFGSTQQAAHMISMLSAAISQNTLISLTGQWVDGSPPFANYPHPQRWFIIREVEINGYHWWGPYLSS